MSRLFVALSLVVLVAAGARAQDTVIDPETQAVIDEIEAQLTAQDLPADIDAATDEQIAIATAQLVNPSRGATELAALVRAAVTARPGAVEQILAEATGAAAAQGFSTETIGAMLAAAIGALEAQGLAVNVDQLVQIVAQATGLSETDVAEAVADAEEDGFAEEDLIEEENPAQDASPS